MERSDVRAETHPWDLALGCAGRTWQAESVTCEQKSAWDELRNEWMGGEGNESK